MSNKETLKVIASDLNVIVRTSAGIAVQATGLGISLIGGLVVASGTVVTAAGVMVEGRKNFSRRLRNSVLNKILGE